MHPRAYFSGIREKIVEHLAVAKAEILVAVAWLSDREPFDILVACQRREVTVSLVILDDKINRKTSVVRERLTAATRALCCVSQNEGEPTEIYQSDWQIHNSIAFAEASV